jgi:NADH-quinone oxidoreductase subunit M
LRVVTVLAVWGALIIGAVYMLRAVRAALHGPMPEKWANISDANPWRKLPYALLIASLLVFGFFPRLLTDKIKPVTELIVKMATTGKEAVVVEESRSSGRESARHAPVENQSQLTSAATE